MVGPTPSEALRISWHLLTCSDDEDEPGAIGSLPTFRALVLVR